MKRKQKAQHYRMMETYGEYIRGRMDIQSRGPCIVQRRSIMLALGVNINGRDMTEQCDLQSAQTRLSTVTNMRTYHQHLRLVFGNFVFEEEIMSSLELSILAKSLFNGGHKVTVHKA